MWSVVDNPTLQVSSCGMPPCDAARDISSKSAYDSLQVSTEAEAESQSGEGGSADSSRTHSLLFEVTQRVIRGEMRFGIGLQKFFSACTRSYRGSCD